MFNSISIFEINNFERVLFVNCYGVRKKNDEGYKIYVEKIMRYSSFGDVIVLAGGVQDYRGISETQSLFRHFIHGEYRNVILLKDGVETRTLLERLEVLVHPDKEMIGFFEVNHILKGGYHFRRCFNRYESCRLIPVNFDQVSKTEIIKRLPKSVASTMLTILAAHFVYFRRIELRKRHECIINAQRQWKK